MSMGNVDPGSRNSGVSQTEMAPQNTAGEDQRATRTVANQRFSALERQRPAEPKKGGFSFPKFKPFKNMGFPKFSLNQQKPEFKEAVTKLKDLNPNMTGSVAKSNIKQQIKERESDGMTRQAALTDINVELEKQHEIKTLSKKLGGNEDFRNAFITLVQREACLTTAEAKLLVSAAVLEKTGEMPEDTPMNEIVTAACQDIVAGNDTAPTPPTPIQSQVPDVGGADETAAPKTFKLRASQFVAEINAINSAKAETTTEPSGSGGRTVQGGAPRPIQTTSNLLQVDDTPAEDTGSVDATPHNQGRVGPRFSDFYSIDTSSTDGSEVDYTAPFLGRDQYEKIFGTDPAVDPRGGGNTED